MSYRRTNDGSGREVARSTAGATGGGDHEMAGRISAAVRPNIATFCRCGLAFFGHDVDQADHRWREHRDNVISAQN